MPKQQQLPPWVMANIKDLKLLLAAVKKLEHVLNLLGQPDMPLNDNHVAKVNEILDYFTQTLPTKLPKMKTEFNAVVVAYKAMCADVATRIAKTREHMHAAQQERLRLYKENLAHKK